MCCLWSFIPPPPCAHLYTDGCKSDEQKWIQIRRWFIPMDHFYFVGLGGSDVQRLLRVGFSWLLPFSNIWNRSFPYVQLAIFILVCVCVCVCMLHSCMLCRHTLLLIAVHSVNIAQLYGTCAVHLTTVRWFILKNTPLSNQEPLRLGMAERFRDGEEETCSEKGGGKRECGASASSHVFFPFSFMKHHLSFTGLPVYRFTGLPVYRFTGIPPLFPPCRAPISLWEMDVCRLLYQ